MRHQPYGCVLVLLIALAILVATTIHPTVACGLFGVLIAAAILIGIQRWRANRPYTVAWRCAKCGYGLFGATQPTCPECGHPISDDQIRNAPPGLYGFGTDEETEGRRD